MADSKRELIMKNVDTVLTAISIVNSVQRLRQSGMKKNIVPALWIGEGPEDAEDHPSRRVKKTLEIAVAAINRHDEAEDTLSSAEFFSPLRDEVDKALMADPTRGGNAVNTTYPTWDEIEIEEGAPELVYVARFNVVYFHSATDPSV